MKESLLPVRLIRVASASEDVLRREFHHAGWRRGDWPHGARAAGRRTVTVLHGGHRYEANHTRLGSFARAIPA